MTTLKKNLHFCLSALIIGILYSGCTHYNAAVPRHIEEKSLSNNQYFYQLQNKELLLNLVRIRYNEPTLSLANQFESPGNINSTSRSHLSRSEINDLSLENVSINLLYSLIQSDWPLDQVFSLCLEKLSDYNNSIESRNYSKFVQLTQSLNEINGRGDLTLLKLPSNWNLGPDFQSPNVVKLTFVDKNEAESFAGTIGKNGQLMRDANGRISQLLLLIAEDQSLKVDYKGEDLTLVTVQTSSLYQIFKKISHTIQPPQRHVTKGLTSKEIEQLKNSDEEISGAYLLNNNCKITAQRFPSFQSFAKVYYRGYWFQIQDCDLNSKKIFSLLHVIRNLHMREVMSGPIK